MRSKPIFCSKVAQGCWNSKTLLPTTNVAQQLPSTSRQPWKYSLSADLTYFVLPLAARKGKERRLNEIKIFLIEGYDEI